MHTQICRIASLKILFLLQFGSSSILVYQQSERQYGWILHECVAIFSRKVLKELVFTGRTVPVVQVQYQHSVGSSKGTVAAQYSLW